MSQIVSKAVNLDIAAFIANFNSKHTRDAYTRDLVNFSKFLSDNGVVINHPAQLQLTHLIAYRNYLVLKFESKTVSRKLASIKSLMNWLESTGAIRFNPASALKVPTANVATPTNALLDEEVTKMLDFAKQNDTHYLMLLFLFTYGLRRGELCSIKLTDFFNGTDSVAFTVHGKGGKTRILPITNELLPLVQSQMSKSNEYLFEHYKTPFTPSGIYAIFKRYAQMAGITRDVSPHSARATVATKALENNVPITQVAEDLGHSSINTTQIYWKRRNGLVNSMVHKIKY